MKLTTLVTSSYLELLHEMQRVVQAAGEQKIQLRAFGGVAIRFKSEHAVVEREYHDLDFVSEPLEYARLRTFFESIDYVPDKRFNLLNDAGRQIYYYKDTDRHVDVFVGDFEMCHKIPMKSRLQYDRITVPLAELLLSKTQIVELNRKDALDIATLLLSNELGEDDNRKINLKQIAQLCGNDWGLYKTTSINLNKVEEIVSKEEQLLPESERTLIVNRVRQILSTFEQMPKSLAWQMRDKVGTRVRWYTEVEEVRR